MANHCFGITVPFAGGGDVSAVSTSTGGTSKNVELVVLDGVTGRSKVQLIKALELFIEYIATHDEPA